MKSEAKKESPKIFEFSFNQFHATLHLFSGDPLVIIQIVNLNNLDYFESRLDIGDVERLPNLKEFFSHPARLYQFFEKNWASMSIDSHGVITLGERSSEGEPLTIKITRKKGNTYQVLWTRMSKFMKDFTKDLEMNTKNDNKRYESIRSELTALQASTLELSSRNILLQKRFSEFVPTDRISHFIRPQLVKVQDQMIKLKDIINAELREINTKLIGKTSKSDLERQVSIISDKNSDRIDKLQFQSLQYSSSIRNVQENAKKSVELFDIRSKELRQNFQRQNEKRQAQFHKVMRKIQELQLKTISPNDVVKLASNAEIDEKLKGQLQSFIQQTYLKFDRMQATINLVSDRFQSNIERIKQQIEGIKERKEPFERETTKRSTYFSNIISIDRQQDQVKQTKILSSPAQIGREQLYANHPKNPHKNDFVVVQNGKASLYIKHISENGYKNFINKTEVLPASRVTYCLKLKELTLKNLFIGLGTQGNFGFQGNLSEGIFYYCGTGIIYDGEQEHKSNITSDIDDQIRIQVDLQTNIISWKKNGSEFFVSKLPDKLVDRSLFLALRSFYNNDTVELFY